MSDAPGRALVPGCADGVITAAADSHPFEVSMEQSAVATAASTGDRSAQIIIAGHVFVQNMPRGHYELGNDTHWPLRVAAAFTELALTI